MATDVDRADELRRAGNLPQALAALTRVLELDPSRADAWLVSGLALADAGALEEAEASLRRAARLAPLRPEPWLHLGRILALRGVRDEPLVCWRRALDAAPGHVDAAVRLGAALVERGELDEAGAELSGSLERAPKDPGVVAAVARLHERRGHADDAGARCATVRRPHPRGAHAAARAGRRSGRAAEALRIVDAAIGASPVDGDRVLLLHARGDLCDALERHDEAFASWSRANARRGLGFDPDRHRRAIDRVIARTQGRRWPAPIPEAERVVLVVGVPRSGTTLLEQALGRHPDVAPGGELEALRDVALAVPRPGELDWLDALDRIDDAIADRLAAAYLSALDAVDPSALRVVDKMPNNLLHLGLLARLLPGARVILCRRDPDDVALSCFRTPFGAGLPWAASLEGIRAWQREADRLWDHWSATLPLRTTEVQYEDLVERPEATLRDALSFLDLPFHPAVLAPEGAKRAVGTASALQVLEPIHARYVGRSRPYAAWLSGT